MSIFSNFISNEDLQYRIEELLISNSTSSLTRKSIVPKCNIKSILESTIALLDKKFFENDVYLFYILKELREEEISNLFIPAFKGVFNLSIDRVIIIK